jgi:hypothetical protein
MKYCEYSPRIRSYLSTHYGYLEMTNNLNFEKINLQQRNETRGLYYKICTIVIYHRNGSTIVGQYYKT